jgi:hypothetical protein
MAGRIQFARRLRFERQSEMAHALAPLAQDGWDVTVEHPFDGSRQLGWLVRIDAPGMHHSFRLRMDAAADAWAAEVRAARERWPRPCLDPPLSSSA